MNMKRRTNLFYNSGDESNFLTFSNYTEALTGNHLSTDTKLYPSAFICLNIAKLTKDTKQSFINDILISKYENKLAVLRDYCDANNLSVEETVKPLDYLLKYCKDYDKDMSIEYIGNITEQQYNGIYSDTICVIDPTNINYDYSLNGNGTINYIAETSTCLHGWDNITLPASITNSPVFDNNTNYNIGTTYTAINFTNNSAKNEIKFNVIIPLFDILNINSDTNTAIIDESIKNIDLTASGLNKEYLKYVPLGIWFSNNCTPIILTKDAYTGFMPSWSLVISSQFKPIPYSNNMQADRYKANNVTEAYCSFAQVLVKQDALNKRIDTLANTVTQLSTAVITLSSKLNEIGTTSTIDEMKTMMLNFAESLQSLSNDVESLSNKINN